MAYFSSSEEVDFSLTDETIEALLDVTVSVSLSDQSDSLTLNELFFDIFVLNLRNRLIQL